LIKFSTMKKYFLLFALIVIGFTSCTKEDDSISSAPATTASEAREMPGVSSVPSTFTQKLLLEMYTTTGCATCPDAQYKCRTYAANNPDRVYGVSVHTYDAMASPQYGVLNNLFNITAYSSGSFNRLPFNNLVVLHKTTWTNTIVNTCLNKTATCGLKINSSYSGTTAQVTVTAGFNTLIPNDYYLTVYLIEDSVSGTGSGWDQSNYYNAIASSPFYQMGNPIVGYQHNMVLRNVLTPSMGEPISQRMVNKSSVFAKSFSINIAGYDPTQLHIVAFINKVGTTATTHEVMNVQKAKLGTNKNWD
jgi:Outer membrane protein Omp28